MYTKYEKKKQEEINKDLKLLKSDDVYNKIKFIRPQQISVSGLLDMNIIKKSIEELKKIYKNLIDSKKNENLSQSVSMLTKEKDDLVYEINVLKEKLNNKNKILDSLIPHSNNRNITFSNTVYSNMMTKYNLN